MKVGLLEKDAGVGISGEKTASRLRPGVAKEEDVGELLVLKSSV